MSDQGADTNFILPYILGNIKDNTWVIMSEQLHPVQINHNVAGDPCLTWTKSIKLDVFLKFKHGLSLILGNSTWKVAEEELQALTTGQMVRGSVSYDNRITRMTIRDKIGDNIDVNERLRENGNEESQEGIISALYVESLFNRERYTGEDE